MEVPPAKEKEHEGTAHIDIIDDRPSPRADGEPSPSLRDSKGWDGKLRIPKSALVANPEALSDPEYSDDSNVLHGEEIRPDESKTSQGLASNSVREYRGADLFLFMVDLLDSEDSGTDEIMCSHSRISSISALRLSRFKNVARICLRQNVIQDIESLEGLADTLEELDLYDNLISHIRGLDGLTKLTSLDLSFNKIKHIKHINHLKDLKELFLVANKISKIEGLEGLDNLKSLELGSNRIREIQNLDSLQNLEELWLAKNKITELSGLGGLPKLRLLSIQSNRIRDLSPLKEVPGLEELYIAHNALETLEGIENNTSLKILEISNNQITSLKGVGPLSDLEELWASYNRLGDFAEVERELKDKEDLTTVYFEGNPLQLRGPALYRNKVRLALPQVKQIDASEYSPPPMLFEFNQRLIHRSIRESIGGDSCGDLGIYDSSRTGCLFWRKYYGVHRTITYALASFTRIMHTFCAPRHSSDKT